MPKEDQRPDELKYRAAHMHLAPVEHKYPYKPFCSGREVVSAKCAHAAIPKITLVYAGADQA